MNNHLLTGFMALACLAAAAAEEKDIGEPAPIAARHWDGLFEPNTTTLVGSYVTVIRQATNQFVAFNNSVDGSLAGGLNLWRGKDHRQFEPAGIVFQHDRIDDVFGPDGALFGKRRLTRPFIDWHPDHGFVGVVHVCADYGPVDGRVYPALVTSSNGAAGSWQYKGKLKGEVWELFGDRSGNARWADGGAFLFQPGKRDKLNRARPLENRYVMYSNQYAGNGTVALLFSADGISWFFYRQGGRPEGAIVNLLPEAFAGRSMIFPHIVPMGKHGWTMFLAENWPPTAIYRLWSPDGLSWQELGAQPEIVKPETLMIKNLNGWFDPDTATLHGYLSVWSKQPDGSLDYNKYHAATRTLKPADVKEP